MRIHPDSFAFTLLLGLLSALPTFGIDMILPTLSSTGVALGAAPAEVGLAMSVYLLGIGVALLCYGPLSDRLGRKPIIAFGCVVLIAASIGCLCADSLSQLLVFRMLQGAGAAGPGMGAVTIVSDLFDGAAAQARMSSVVFAVNIVPMIAPTVGAALLVGAGWRAVYLIPLAGGCILLLGMSALTETAAIDLDKPLRLSGVLRDYARIATHPVCMGNILCNATAAGAVFAYISGSTLFFINVLGLGPGQYGLIFGVSSLAVMAATVANRRLSAGGTLPGRLIGLGLILTTVLATCLVVMAFVGGKSGAVVVLVMVGVALSFGLISPNAMVGALQSLPDIAGSVGAVMAFVQMAAAASSSALVAAFFDGRSARSMGVVMLCFAVLAMASYFGIVRPYRKSAPCRLLYPGVDDAAC